MPRRNPRPPLETAVGPVTQAERTAVERTAPMDLVTRKIVDGLMNFDPERTAAEIVNLRRQGVQIVVEIGRRLMQAHDHYAREGGGHGTQGEGFKGFCERAGLGKSSAYNYIGVVRRLAEQGLLDGGETPLLRIDAGVSKMMNILELGSEDIQVLSEGGTVVGIGDLDAVERMTAGELRARLRDRDRELARARQVQDELTDRVKNAESAVSELRRKQESPHEPNPIERECAGLLISSTKMMQQWQERPQPERIAAHQGVFNILQQIMDNAQIALLHGTRGNEDVLPLPSPADLSPEALANPI